MFTEEKIDRINKVIKDMVFEFKGEISTDLWVVVEYQFQITGVRPMISVGEYYNYLTVNVNVINGDRRFGLFMKISPSFITEYRLLRDLNSSISDELSYFFDGSYVRVHIPKESVVISDEYQKEIDSIDFSITNS